jgi:hypothetical protein
VAKEKTMRRKFLLARIETARETLDSLPAADAGSREVGIQKTVQILAPTIRKLLAKGYSKNKVIELLAEQGLQIGVGAIREYFRARPGRSSGKKNGLRAEVVTR